MKKWTLTEEEFNQLLKEAEKKVLAVRKLTVELLRLKETLRKGRNIDPAGPGQDSSPNGQAV